MGDNDFLDSIVPGQEDGLIDVLEDPEPVPLSDELEASFEGGGGGGGGLPESFPFWLASGGGGGGGGGAPEPSLLEFASGGGGGGGPPGPACGGGLPAPSPGLSEDDPS